MLRYGNDFCWMVETDSLAQGEQSICTVGFWLQHYTHISIIGFYFIRFIIVSIHSRVSQQSSIVGMCSVILVP